MSVDARLEPVEPPAAASPPSAGSPRVAPAPTPPTTAVDPVAGYRVTVVPHTHWDREWYLPFELFRIRLARTVERICEVLESEPRFRSFTLDGQSVILEDVVELRPDLEPRIRALLADGRLITGPSYVLPDEFLTGQEALVRNLLIGRAVCEEFGATAMGVAYMPDPFGHVAQFPQILRGFGLDAFIFWRGLGDDAGRVGVAFDWQAPDGSSVTAIRQLGSYGNASQLGRWAAGGIDLAEQPDRYRQAAAARAERFVTTYASELGRTPTTEILLCNGSDHESIHEPLPDLIDHARLVHRNTVFDIGSYDEYWARLRPSLAGRQLEVISSELAGGRDAPVLRGINSTRIYLKQEAERTERALLSAETLAALAYLRDGSEPPLDELRLAWREQLRNMPHDSISGCSIDEVARDMAVRSSHAQEIARRVGREALARLAGVGARWTARPQVAPAATIANTLAFERRSVVELHLPDELRDRPVTAVAGDEVLPAQVVPSGANGPRVSVAIDVDGFGLRDLRLLNAPGGKAARADGPVRAVTGDTITNGLLTVQAHPDGTIDLTDERTGRTFSGLHRFEDVADRGDEYNFCPVEFDSPRGVEEPGTVRVVAAGPVFAELGVAFTLRLPRRLSEDRRRRVGKIGMPVRTRIRLTAGIDRVEFSTTIDNRARDHRLRVRFPAPDTSDLTPVRAEGHFGVVRRTAWPVWSGSGWTEPPALTNHTAGAVAAGDVAIIGRGLPEYEAVPTRDGLELALTLLRCVGWLSRDDLATRAGGAGPTLPTPGAQCLGRWTFEYALAIGAERWTDTDLLRASVDYRTPLAIGPARVSDEVEFDPVLAVNGDVIVTALKPAEDGHGAIVRLVNAGTVSAPFDVRGAFRTTPVRLDETDASEAVSDEIRPGEIRTFRLLGA